MGVLLCFQIVSTLYRSGFLRVSRVWNNFVIILIAHSVDTDILKPNTGYVSIERPSHTNSSKGTSDRQSSGVLTPNADHDINRYAEPVSDGEEDEDMDITPAKDEGRRTGLTDVEVAEAIAYREQKLKDAAAQGKKAAHEELDEEADEEHSGDINERTPFLRGRPIVKEPVRPRAFSIDPLAPSSAFDETLKERLRGAKSAKGASGSDDNAVIDDDDEEEELAGPSGGERELIRHFRAPAGKRVSMPVRIEPKVYFANERTFLVSPSVR